MILTPQQLQAISPGTPLERCATFVPHLNKYCPKYLIDTPIEMASFLSQILHESGGLIFIREIWGPTTQQLRYERDFAQPFTPANQRNKLAFTLGNTEKGYGRKYAGVGPIQTTGRANIKRMSIDMFADTRLLDTPDLLATPEYGVWSACIYWQWRNMDLIDDDNDI